MSKKEKAFVPPKGDIHGGKGEVVAMGAITTVGPAFGGADLAALTQGSLLSGVLSAMDAVLQHRGRAGSSATWETPKATANPLGRMFYGHTYPQMRKTLSPGYDSVARIQKVLDASAGLDVSERLHMLAHSELDSDNLAAAVVSILSGQPL